MTKGELQARVEELEEAFGSALDEIVHLHEENFALREARDAENAALGRRVRVLEDGLSLHVHGLA